MNLFFAPTCSDFNCELTIPKFNNYGIFFKNPRLIKYKPIKNQWYAEIFNSEEDENFYYIKDNADNNNFFSILEKENVVLKNFDHLDNFDTFTDGYPSYRANLKLKTKFNSFSSYQSEYPFPMINQTSNILCSTGSLNNLYAKKKFLIFPNIEKSAKSRKASAKIIELNKNKILQEFELKNNFINIIDLSELKKNVYFYSNKISGIPIFVSIDFNNNITIEHTHPPHSFFDSYDNFSISKKFKNKFENLIK